MPEQPRPSAPRNKTIRLSEDDRLRLEKQLAVLPRGAKVDTPESGAVAEAPANTSNQGSDAGAADVPADAPAHGPTADPAGFSNRVFQADALELCRAMPDASVDLIFADPPYQGIRKQFHSSTFHLEDGDTYSRWLKPCLAEFRRILKPEGSLYLCGDWRGAPAIQTNLEQYFTVHNRITWEREKGRGAKRNWKNAHEDIWFCSPNGEYTFNLDEVKILREVKAPYTSGGRPKDWEQSRAGAFRLTHPGNCWTDISVPFWSMSENTDHPTQKPEKLLARIILASSRPGDLIFDPFLGSGTTAAVAKKLGRRWCGGEREREYALLSLRRLELAESGGDIQGTIRLGKRYIFLQRNTTAEFAAKIARELGNN